MSMRKSVVTSPRSIVQVGRNAPCPCGSEKKYKNCCIVKGDIFLRKLAQAREKEAARERKVAEKAAKKKSAH